VSAKADVETHLKDLGVEDLGTVYRNISNAALYEEALLRGEGLITKHGAIVLNSVPYTGRAPEGKYTVETADTKGKVNWGKINRPMSPEDFDALKARMCVYLAGADLFVQDSYVGAEQNHRLQVRVITECAVGALFSQNMFLHIDDEEELESFTPDFTVLHAPNFHAEPERDGTEVDAIILVNFDQKLVLIGGTAYCGEIKKSIFTVMNYLLPQQGVMTMHSSANYGQDINDVAVFFGLSGTGKTTLSAVPERTLIGDDEHGWSDQGVFNFEGGCYAKVIRLSEEGEPEIYATTKRFGTIMENVFIDPKTREIDLNDATFTENTRASYPMHFIPNMALDGVGGHPKNIIMLTCDAFGVLPPVAKLTHEQAMQQFVLGYTAKVAGTETGITEPQVTFSPCFGGPFMPLPPSVYAKLLGEKILKHRVDVWLLNTGWSGGPYGEGERMPLSITRAIVRAILNGTLAKVPAKADACFGFQIPDNCPGVDSKILHPRATWKDRASYDAKAGKLARLFEAHIKEHAADLASKGSSPS